MTGEAADRAVDHGGHGVGFWTPVLLTGLAGAAFGLVDAATVAGAAGTGGAIAGVLVLDALGGALLGLLLWLLLALGQALHRPIARFASRSAVDGLLAAPLAYLLAHELFSGAGVSRTLLGALGPILFPPLGALLVWLGSALARRLLRASRGASLTGRAVLAVPIVAFAAGARVADVQLFVGLYEYLHALLALAALALLALAVALLFPRRPPPGRPVVAAITAIGLAGIPFLLTFPATTSERGVLLRGPLLASRVRAAITFVADLDRDGASFLLGGGDCDDLDPDTGPAAVEVIGNGRDEDCDGADLASVEALLAPVDRPCSADGVEIGRTAARYPTVLLLIDALRADRLALDRFPNLHRLSRESIRFDWVFAPASSTAHVIPALVTGRIGPRPDDPRVGELLQGSDRRAALVVIDLLLEEFMRDPAQPLTVSAYADGKGFDHVEVVSTEHTLDRLDWGGGIAASTTVALVERAVSLLDSADPPELLWVHIFDLHQWAHLALDGLPAGVERYDAVLATIDRDLEPILARADRLNLVVVADHGEGLGEHDNLYHTRTLYRELVHVPLLVRVPGVAPARITTPVPLVDLMPTLLHLTGVAPDGSPAERSLLCHAGEPDRPGRRIGMFDKDQWSLVAWPHQLIYTPKAGLVELFDLAEDPAEMHNLSDALPSLTAKLLSQLRAVRASLER